MSAECLTLLKIRLAVVLILMIVSLFPCKLAPNSSILLMQVPYQTREASEETDTGQPNQLRSRSVTIGQSDSIKTGLSNYLPERSLTVGHNRDSSGMRMVEIPFTEGSEELPSLKKRLDAEGSSDEGDGLSRSSSRGGVNVTLSSWTEGNENGLDLKALSLLSGYSRSSSCTSSIAGCSSNGGLSFIDRSFDNSLYDQLQQAMEESENEASRRRKAEKDKIEAMRRVKYLKLLSCFFIYRDFLFFYTL
ncbi:hypothetical protein F2P56_026705 [Juglans regia]|uniref:Uncharacterized protein n=1 Tax=Juglans regia TaxID=51240 RepID=A0A833WYP6_JUGRE|nr:hypothetical protein F2P56_026705 [Juglans regia]